jgi:hypothetical protein
MDGRDKPGHDEFDLCAPIFALVSSAQLSSAQLSSAQFS